MIQKEYSAVTIDNNGRTSSQQQKRQTKTYLRSQLRRWRWWNYVQAVFCIVAVTEFILFITSSILLQSTNEPVRFDIRIYPQIPYHELDTSPIQLPSQTNVYHVTKEFGIATMGGMGTALTALAQAQLQSGRIKPVVVMPYYSFLKKQEQYPIRTAVEMVTTFKDDQGKVIPVEFKVYQMVYDFNPIPRFGSLPKEEKAALMSKTLHANRTMRVYLIGPGKIYPLHKSFHANSITQLYSTPRQLPQEWKDQYFCKAVASFIIWRATGRHEQSLFAPLAATPPHVDVVHLHGATNGYVAKYMKDFASQKFTNTPPTVVYTMHDYLDELQYTNSLENVDKFWTNSKENIQERLSPYMFGSNKVFMSPLAIDAADVVTFVSRKMAKSMTEGSLDFYLKEVIMNSLLKKAEKKNFYGISHGVALSPSINPFTEPKLVKNGLNFSTPLKSETKRLAKQFLIAQGQLLSQDLHKPLVLYVGRFQYNKGLETFAEAIGYFRQYDIKFAIIGQPNNYPLEWVEQLAKENPDQVILMTTVRQQEQWLSYYRAAADFVYVPSETESFGLVAVEGMAHGSAVISTGAGGLSEFLVDRRSSVDFNAYLFNTQEQGSLERAIQTASEDYHQLMRSLEDYEAYVTRMMQSALSLAWDRGDEQGPLYDYLRLYQKAINEKKLDNRYRLKEDI
ncbi:hypothetical protein G6F70_005575 [Rhizopus microsporus]|uniref:UDP-Glycosyltransferase/glycogen phosphorylase n=1 Tax=Rhizopus microsporus TaxID=58291 RepID=A0A1X0SD04_RHIZD|nr:hypothetical protein G6F71_006327 [Rhizopus microsporus]KAG1198704.1 hypothetical protein G6F70_005575 [Rhizopus microsporus]KAG1209461.1 hypothetical protein G6F69_006331 [Rhizopus microsporus]KAG1236480.1 hypothetical protein G6F67_001964 [Rhizopus microsporus]KAG1263237.1 hypothetical protein G6F68_005295 [Rhizopus microsporus]